MMHVKLKGIKQTLNVRKYSVLTLAFDPWGGVKGLFFFLSVAMLHIKLTRMKHIYHASKYLGLSHTVNLKGKTCRKLCIYPFLVARIQVNDPGPKGPLVYYNYNYFLHSVVC